MKLLLSILLCLLLFVTQTSNAQNKDSVMIRKIYSWTLENGKAYEWLDFLCNKIGSRLTGSVNAEKAIGYTKAIMEAEKYGTVKLQPVTVPRWRRNDIETLNVSSGSPKTPFRICSLGGSIATPPGGIKAKVIEVKSFAELDSLGKSNISGKIVFYNVPFDQEYVRTFHAYSEVGKYRWSGAMNAAKYGAVASITRSMTNAMDDIPHTGSMGYSDTLPRIPACAISTKGAEALSSTLKLKPKTELELKMNCDTLPDSLSFNVIAEIPGTEFPNEIVLVGGHLDSWDKGHGAHDDGAGCVQSMEVLKAFKELGIKPKRTVRIVLFINEENGGKGGKQYAESAKVKGENHIAAIETDAGGFTPHGFSSVCTDSTKREKIIRWSNLFEPYGLYDWKLQHGGSDIDHLKDQGTLLIGLVPDSQRYFDYHHAETDTFDKINKRELELGAAALASLVYLLSEYGVK